MKLNTISASAFTTFEECPARYYAEYVQRTPRTGGPGPAGVGTCCHSAIENYIRVVYLDKQHDIDLHLLVAFYDKSFIEVFNTADKTSLNYKDGLSMIKRWWERTDLDRVHVISLELKSSIDINTVDGPRKFNYIWDRCEEFTDGDKKILRIVDLKTIRANLSPDDLRHKIQARMYAMAAATQFKDVGYDEIWIMYDLLRYNTIEVKFTREDNIETWKYVRKTANRILGMSEKDIPEIISPGCSWCVRKTTCETLQSNIQGAGIMSLADDNDALAAAQDKFTNIKKAAGYALDEINNLITAYAKETDQIEYDTDNYEVEFTSRKTRYTDDEEVATILGPELMSRYGKLNLEDIEKLLKGTELTVNQKSLLRGSIKEKFSSMKPKVTKKLGLDG